MKSVCPSNKRYKPCIDALAALLCTLMLLVPKSTLAEEKIVKKTTCLSAFPFTSPDEARQNLLLSAKRDAVNEIFGEMISSSTAVRDFELAKDEIQSASIGLIRVNGSVDFFNAAGFGEVCATINAFAKDGDFERFEPLLLSKKACHTDPNLTTRNLKDKTRVLARLQLLTQYDTGLQAYSEGKVVLPSCSRQLVKHWQTQDQAVISAV